MAENEDVQVPFSAYLTIGESQTNMKKLLALLLPLALLTACKEEGCLDPNAENYNPAADENCCCLYPTTPQNFTLRIQVVDDAGEPLSLASPELDDSLRLMQIERFDFYLSNIKLISSTDTALISDVSLMRYNNDPLVITADVPQGTYTGLRLSLGLDSLTNLTDPNSVPNDHPLSQSQNTYWTWQQMYRFAMIEGRIDTDNDSNMDQIFAYHIGENQAFRELALPVTYTQGESGELIINLDYTELFLTDQRKIDLTEDPFCHMNSAEADQRGNMFMDNFMFAFSN